MTKNLPTKAERERMQWLARMPCIIWNEECEGRTTIHHCDTGMGRRKDHSKTIGLCWRHHLGDLGIDGKKMGKRVWEARYGTEESLLEKTKALLEAS